MWLAENQGHPRRTRREERIWGQRLSAGCPKGNSFLRSAEGAQSSRLGLIPPLQGWDEGVGTFPGALPQAVGFRPLGAKKDLGNKPVALNITE